MKQYFHAFVMCQSMFCSIPSPWNLWDEEARDKMLLFLPAVGLEIGVLWYLLAQITQWLRFPALFSAFLLCAFPYAVTGFIHLDGFMDVTDAVKSCRSLERRREILKDSHVGSFAVIGLCLLLLAQFSLFAGGNGSSPVLIFLPAVSRCCSALAVTSLRPMSTSQYAGQKHSGTNAAFLWLMLAALTLLGLLLCGKDGFALLGCLAGYGLALRHGFKSLDGMNGDIAGYALTIAEVCAVAVYTLF